MMERSYWLNVFNQQSWQEFLDAGGDVMGFPERRIKTVFSIKPGDYLISYLSKASCWFAVLEVVSEPYEDVENIIWSQAIFPCRVGVKVIARLSPETGVPILSIREKLDLFRLVKNNHWSWIFRNVPRPLSKSDGQLICEEISKKVQ